MALSLRWLVVCALVLISSRAQAFSVALRGGEVSRWASPLVSYYLQLAGSDNLSPDKSLAAVRAGFASWASIGCSNLVFEELGDVTDVGDTLALAQANGKNELFWLEDERWTLGGSVLGVTIPIANNEGQLVEVDIAFNGLTVTWTSSGNGGIDLEAVAVHEIGHMVGIQHNIGPYNWTEPPTMTPSTAGKQTRSLEEDDVMAACFLYPAADVYHCADDSECPKVLGRDEQLNEVYTGALHCSQDGVCDELEVYLAGIAGLGETCPWDTACVDGLMCQPLDEETSICTTLCNPGADPETEPDQLCEAGFECAPFQAPYALLGICAGANGQVWEPGQGPWGCQTGATCQEGELCLPVPTGERRLCAALCEVGDDSTCPTGQVCWGYGNPTGGCFDAALLPVDEAEPGPEVEVVEAVGDEASDPDPEPMAEPTHDVVEALQADAPAARAADDGGGCDAGGATPGWPLAFGLLWLLWRRLARATEKAGRLAA